MESGEGCVRVIEHAAARRWPFYQVVVHSGHISLRVFRHPSGII